MALFITLLIENHSAYKTSTALLAVLQTALQTVLPTMVHTYLKLVRSSLSSHTFNVDEFGGDSGFKTLPK